MLRPGKVGIIKEGASELAKGAVIGPYAFESCAKLEQLSLPCARAGPDALTMPSPPAGIPQGCFHSSGILSVTLGVYAAYIGHRAHENCKQLISVDISNTVVGTLHMHTFSSHESTESSDAVRTPAREGSVIGLQVACKTAKPSAVDQATWEAQRKTTVPAYENAKLSKAREQRSQVHVVLKVQGSRQHGHLPPPRGGECIVAATVCGGDSDTALPQESQKDNGSQ